jgi:hypothetical protein
MHAYNRTGLDSVLDRALGPNYGGTFSPKAASAKIQLCLADFQLSAPS